MNETLIEKVAQQRRLTAPQRRQLVERAASASFGPDLLPVDAPLWGSFWQFDVLGPASRLPGLELALLRATRLDGGWPAETTPDQFLETLHRAVRHPCAGLWTLLLVGQPLAVLAAPLTLPGLTVVWYGLASQHLHAGYATGPGASHFGGMTQQQAPAVAHNDTLSAVPPDWLPLALEQRAAEPPEHGSPAGSGQQLDTEILRWRWQHP